MAEISGCNGNHEVVLNVNGETRISIVWGLAVMVLVYSLGSHLWCSFQPCCHHCFATCKRFPLKQLKLLDSTLAAGTLRLLFSGPHDVFAGTSPQGSDLQAFGVEFIITFLPNVHLSGVATDNRAIGELAGLAIGATVLINVMLLGQLQQHHEPSKEFGTCNCVESLQGIWIYLMSPTLGAVSGAWVYTW
ncbi:hypothetical protein ERO13_A01G080660v2 [Gossypium hirsutum]|nr:hypothetical protein ERO13_A01G080660v2 [Gossypium hirsutum]